MNGIQPDWGWDNARAILGVFVVVGVAWLLSENKKRFPWKLTLGAIVMMYVFTILLFAVPPVRDGLNTLNDWIDVLVVATREGTKFVFGGLIGDQTAWEKFVGAPGPIFIFQLLPLIIVIGSLAAMLWHWGILKIITKGFAILFERTMGISGAASLSVAANIFMGQTEAPLLIKPYLKTMSRAELLIVMSTGFATIAGSVLVIYRNLLTQCDPTTHMPIVTNALAHLITVSITASPAAVALSLIMVPETTKIEDKPVESEFKYHSTMDAFAAGATDGIAIIWNIATMLIAALAIVYIANAILGAVPIGWIPGLQGAKLSLDSILGLLFSPFMYMAGVPWEEATKAGAFVGVKTVFTEFVAFLRLGDIKDPLTQVSEHTRVLITYAICGFANFGSMGILIGGLSIMAPERRPDFLQLSWKTLYAGTLATIMAAAVVGSLPNSMFLPTGAQLDAAKAVCLAKQSPAAATPASATPAEGAPAPAAPAPEANSGTGASPPAAPQPAPAGSSSINSAAPAGAPAPQQPAPTPGGTSPNH
ncbi:MAG TPA: nucleoside transporter C-terminal domain-containing protein [Hyphomonadaceae bacterium]|nr:nucleoside transporter C-terminal domain-containing protein [Hyphomonadaceae bacterium]